MRVGFPEALGFHDYHPFLLAFLSAMGAEVVTSGPTTQATLDRGVRAALDEACLPVKVLYGHVLKLLDRDDLDFIFLPRLVSVEPRSYICPKFMGVPDMIRVNVRPRVPLIDTCVDLSRDGTDLSREGAGLRRAAADVARRLGATPGTARDALAAACAAWRGHRAAAGARHGCGADADGLNVLVLGHTYNLFDSAASMGVMARLDELGARCRTVEDFPDDTLERAVAALPRRLFWSSGRRMLGAVRHVASHRCVDGVIQVMSFGCGPDSLVGEMAQREVLAAGGLPFLLLTVDEHTGEAGLLTRLEAFVDMARRRRGRGGAAVALR